MIKKNNSKINQIPKLVIIFMLNILRKTFSIYRVPVQPPLEVDYRKHYTEAKANRIQKIFNTKFLQEASPQKPKTIPCWDSKGEDVFFLKKHNQMRVRIEEDKYNQQQSYVASSLYLKSLASRNQIYGMQFNIRAGGKLQNCILTEWNRDRTRSLLYSSFRRYYPGEPNQIFVLLDPHNLNINPYITEGSYNFQVKIPAIKMICYNQVPPAKIVLDCSYMTIDRPLYLGDVQNYLPRGCYIDPKRYEQQVIIIYQIDFLDAQTKMQVANALRKDGAKQKQKEKKQAQEKNQAAAKSAKEADPKGQKLEKGEKVEKAGGQKAQKTQTGKTQKKKKK